MDIGGWLRSLGLEQYEAAFRENKIDSKVLAKLTADDLKELGVSTVGERRELLAAIAALGEPQRSVADIAAEAPGAPIDASAERRQLTVMFCDLVSSTALSARLDPEDMRAIIGSYHKAVAKAVQEHDGFVAKYMGDGVLAYFGYPRAHEDDAERAVQAGLAIVEAAPGLENAVRETLHVRVGIATGIVVVGDLIGSGEASERGVVGDTPNLAARLQGIAKPDQVVIAEATRRLVGDLFELQDLGAQELKGVSGATRAFGVLRSRSVESRFDAMHGGALTSLVGRGEVIELLLRRWGRAKASEGQVVLLSGEPGIGKSRLTAALMERLTAEPHVRLRYFCSPQRVDSALYPIIAHLERAARFSREDDLKTKLDKLDALLAQGDASREDAGLLTEMLGLANDGRCPKAELTPQQRRQNTLTALVRQIEALSGKSPTLMIFEDAHWSDPSSLETLGRLIDRIERLSVLLVVTHRPEFAPPWIGRSNVTTLTVNRLGWRDIALVIDGIVGNKALPEAIRSDIAERADGVPLFAEEIAKAAMEAASENEVELAIAAIPSARQAVPATLHASLMARLDRLGEAREVAQIGAAIGREFGHDLLTAVAGKSETELAILLDRLVQAGLIFRQGAPPYATYLFKHALVQDTAYGTLLREPRRALHARIAEALESRFADIVDRQPELLARHCAEAGLNEKAAVLWGKAGRRSFDRSALVEAIEQFRRALTLIASLPPTPTLRQQEINLQVAIIPPLMQIKGLSASEPKAAMERARVLIKQAEELGEPIEDQFLLFTVLYGFFGAKLFAFSGAAVRELAAQFLALADEKGATGPIVFGHRNMGIVLHMTGEFPEAKMHFDQAISRYDPVDRRLLLARFGVDPSATSLAYRANTLWHLGFPEVGAADARRAISEAREVSHAPTLMQALAMVGLFDVSCGNYTAASTEIDEGLSSADEKGSRLYKVYGTLLRGALLFLTGDVQSGGQTLKSALASFRSMGATWLSPLLLSYLARAHMKMRQFDDAHRCIGEAIAVGETTGERWCEADLHRIAGEIALMPSSADTTKAEEHFELALSIARAQKARSWELRAAMSLARLWLDQGRRAEAHALLSPVYGWFTEGFDTLDLRDAKALLEELKP
jgi:class 3 adenylate cyclase/predicted ATPase